MGVVWKARQRGLDRVVALKVLPAGAAEQPGFADRFQREARALARLEHPNIVGVHEFGVRDGTFFLVMEFVDGLDMRHALRAGRIGPRDVLRIVPQICDALQYAHDHGVVHRDIKPENVLIDLAGRVKVADFGLAKIVGGDASPQDLTVTGQVMGTPHYMAPEQFEKPTTVDHRADIYSLGVVFYEMLTGELPLGRFPPPSQKFQVDVRFDEVVLRSLEKQPELRWQHASEVKTEVGAIAAGPAARAERASEPARAPSTTPSATALPGATRRVRLGLALAGLTCISAALVILLASGRGSDVAGAVAATLAIVVGFPMIAVVWAMRRRPRAGAAPPLSWLAVAALLAVLIAAVTQLVTVKAVTAGAVAPASANLAYSLCGALRLCGFAAGIVAWTQIARSHGGRRGLPYAITATGLVFVGPFLTNFVVSRPSTDSLRAPAEPVASAPSLIDPIDTREQLKELWFALQAAHPRVTVSDMRRWYVRAAWARISAMWSADGPARAARGELGLPLTAESTLGEPLAAFHGFGLQVDEPAREATLQAFSDRRRITVKFAFEHSAWRFTADPVVVEGRAGSDLPESAVTTTLEDTAAIAVRTCLVLPKTTDESIQLYAPDDAYWLSRIPAAARRERGARGELGLPLLVRSWPPEIARTFVFRRAATSALQARVAVASNGRVSLEAPMRRVGNALAFAAGRVAVRGVEPGDRDYVAGGATALPPDFARLAIRTLMDQVAALEDRTDVESVAPFYSPADRAGLRVLVEARREYLGDDTGLGLPFLPDRLLGAPLGRFEIESLELEPSGLRAMVVARAATRTLRVQFVATDAAHWYVAQEPVVVEGAAPPR